MVRQAGSFSRSTSHAASGVSRQKGKKKHSGRAKGTEAGKQQVFWWECCPSIYTVIFHYLEHACRRKQNTDNTTPHHRHHHAQGMWEKAQSPGQQARSSFSPFLLTWREERWWRRREMTGDNSACKNAKRDTLPHYRGWQAWLGRQGGRLPSLPSPTVPSPSFLPGGI